MKIAEKETKYRKLLKEIMYDDAKLSLMRKMCSHIENETVHINWVVGMLYKEKITRKRCSSVGSTEAVFRQLLTCYRILFSN